MHHNRILPTQSNFTHSRFVTQIIQFNPVVLTPQFKGYVKDFSRRSGVLLFRTSELLKSIHPLYCVFFQISVLERSSNKYALARKELSCVDKHHFYKMSSVSSSSLILHRGKGNTNYRSFHFHDICLSLKINKEEVGCTRRMLAN